MKRRTFLTALASAMSSAGLALPAWAQEVLPFAPKGSGSTAGRTMQDSVYSPKPEQSHLPKNAPNVIIVLLDDVGPALPDTYGGEIHTPTLSRIAKEGVSYNRFHTTAMCSPTRAALLTGRNHQRVGAGQIAELANDWDGYSGIQPKSSAMVGEVLKAYGYSTTRTENGITLPLSIPALPAPSTIGRPAMASNISTAFWEARPPNTNPTSCATPAPFIRPRRQAATTIIT
jgi:Sulfatase